MEPPRLRLKFIGCRILSESQKSDGLKRSWVLLKPQHETVSDVAGHILEFFDLYDSCPSGLILSMDGFVLPPFEPTTIFRDKDLISVRRKGTDLIGAINLHEEANTLVDKIVEEEPTGVKLLDNEEFVNEIGGYESDMEEGVPQHDVILVEGNTPNGDTTHKKRKASKALKNSKAKRLRILSPEKDEISPQKEQVSHKLHNGVHRKNSSKKSYEKENVLTPEVAERTQRLRKLSTENGEVPPPKEQTSHKLHNGVHRKKSSKKSHEQEDIVTPEVAESERTESLRKLSTENGGVSPPKEQIIHKLHNGVHRKKSSKKSYEQEDIVTPEVAEREPGEIGDEATVSSSLPDKSKKSSRSAKRRKSKRRHQLALDKAEMEKVHSKGSPEGDVSRDMEFTKDENSNADKHNQADGESDSEGEIVPVVIRPGHIRFASSGKEKEVQQIEGEKDSFQWNGILSKKQGQKWGQEKQLSTPQSNGWTKEKQFSTPQSNGWSKEKQSTLDYSESAWKKKSAPEWSGWGKDKTSTPVWNGHEASSSNHSLKKAPAVNVSIDFEKLVPMTDSPVQGDTIAYRLLTLSSTFCPELSSYRVGKVSWFESTSKKVMLVPVPEYPFDYEQETDDNGAEELLNTSHYKRDGSLEIDFGSLADVRIVKCGDQNPKADRQIENTTPVASDAPSLEKGKGKNDVWEEISEALIAKKAQLLQEDKWNKKASPSNRTWSHRTLRSNALGPTLALLRAQNGDQVNAQ